jgi:hypothetical protein
MDHNQMFGGYETKVLSGHEADCAIKKIKGYPKVIHIWKGCTTAMLVNLPANAKSLKNSLDQLEKITAALVKNTDGTRKFRQEITIQLKSDVFDDSTIMFDSSVLAANDMHRVHTMGSLYYQAQLIPVITVAQIFQWKNTVDFMGITNAAQPSHLQKLKYSSMYSMVGVLPTTSTSTCFITMEMRHEI